MLFTCARVKSSPNLNTKMPENLKKIEELDEATPPIKEKVSVGNGSN